MNKSIFLSSKRRAVLAASFLVSLLVVGCASVGPDYVAPDLTAPDNWHSVLKDGLKDTSADAEQLAQWWNRLNDPVLPELISMAVDGNLDMKQAVARLRESRARRAIRSADRFPVVDGTGSAATHRISKSSSNTDSGIEREWYTAGFDVGWEIDIFGGVRRGIEAADADFQAVEANLGDIRISLAAETARNYVEVCTYQYRLNVAQTNITVQRETFDLIQSRFEAGLSSELDTQQARYNLESTRSQLPTLRTGLEAAKNRLAILTGQPPGSLQQRLSQPRPIPVTPISVAVGVPAEALRRRPDIRRAERQLAAQTARIGVATAELYPKFQLAGSIGLESIDSEDLFLASSRNWRFGPAFSWRIFDASAIRRSIEVQSAIQEQYLMAYESTVLNALEEVENALTAYAEEQLRREHLMAAVDAAQRAVFLSQDQYAAGLVGFSYVLDAQRSLLTFQDALARSDGTVTANLIALYKALGGGWKSWEQQQQNASE